MIHVIINPAAGQNVPVLATLNSVFRPANLDWDVSITRREGDARKQAAAAVDAGADIVAVYGGDGTVVEAASGLLDSEVPLAILPGGTANVVAQELGIPRDLAAACQLISGREAQTRIVDVGAVNDRHFLIRVGIGMEAQITEKADREHKDRYGFLAYLWSAAQSLTSAAELMYDITIDGNRLSMAGVTCSVINSGNLGVANLQFAPNIRIDDGLLDVILVQRADLPALTELIGNIFGMNAAADCNAPAPGQVSTKVDFNGAVQHWTGSKIGICAHPSSVMQYDGELLEGNRVDCHILPSALRILVPPGS